MRTRSGPALLFGVTLAIAVTPMRTHAQDRIPGMDRAQRLVEEWVASGRIPGAVLSVWRDGAPVRSSAFGWAQIDAYGGGQYGAWADDAAPRGHLERLDQPIPMTTETVFDLASVTKVMATTMAVALLVDRGAVDLDAPVSRYLPDFTGGGKERITIEHLLTHRSGLSQWQPIYYHADDADAAYAYIRDFPLAWPVGAERHYSDLGFMVLGRVVEKVSGQSLDALVRTELYEPLSLETTRFRGLATGADEGPTRLFAATSHGNPYEYRMVHDPDFGYRIDGDAAAWSGWRRYTLSGEVNDGNAHHAFGGVAGHAGLFSDAGDLQVLLRLLLAGGVSHGRRYLAADVVALVLRATGDGQALGWQVPAYAPPGSFVHTGFTGTYVLGVPSLGLSVVLLTNRQNGGVDEDALLPDVGPLQRAVAEALIGASGW